MTEIEEIKEKITPILQKYGVTYAGVFGSVARGEAREDSDVDILVTLPEQGVSLLDFIGLKNDIADCLEKKVDVVSDRAIVPYFKDYIYRDLKTVYEQ